MKMGDIGKVDKNGNMYLTGRIKDIIILRNAKKINASQVRVSQEVTAKVEGRKDESVRSQREVAHGVSHKSGLS